MKRFLLMALVAATLFSCKKEILPDQTNNQNMSSINLTINVNKALSRAIEDGHDGLNDAKVAPKIFAVTVLSYAHSGGNIVLLGSTDLTKDQIDKAIFGNYRKPDGSLGSNTITNTGATIGLPKGTTHVDVVVNRAPIGSYSDQENINYINYRDNTNGDGVEYPFGKDNFDRIILTTSAYDQKGIQLDGHLDPNYDSPTYKINFSVKPHMSRMEVYGAIDVAPEDVWIDGHNNKWRSISVTEYEGFDPINNVANDLGHYPKGAVKGTVDNKFDVNTAYVPEYYWYCVNIVVTPVERTATNSYDNEADVMSTGWVKQPFYENMGEARQVKWLPNRFYAVDVESIFINNIKVLGAHHASYLHPWPGSQAATGWLDWYKAFHTSGWHARGSSADNTFLCMGNMWDRIATSLQTKTITFPELNGVSQMELLIGKADPIAKMSEYYATDVVGPALGRNLGVAKTRAASYAIYSQAKAPTTLPTDAAALRAEMPHVVVKVKAYKDAADYANGTYIAGSEFITITLFSDAAAGQGNYITNFMGGYIYRLNLNDLLYSFIGNVPVPEGVPTEGKDPQDPTDPDPEMPESQLVMTVEVLPWTIQNIYPNI